ncbi:hypothetical protein CTheo_3169 [Ceratobasidium theobromae]|uniref:Uncharacterized protein n=1 Tax=Ceratobasidium theobromae TaxID=1582974 RepID=A0A5N5QPH2_9AGAM|nr:hypothetical protein CTheo_3169 [Ceratobasidium theobromae]
MSDSRGPVYISSGSSYGGSSRYHAGSSYGGSSYVYPERERYASITTLHRPALPTSRSLTSLVGEPSITVIPPSRNKSRSSLGYEPQYTEDGRLRIATVIRRLFGLGPRPVENVKVYDGNNKFWPNLRRKGSKSSTYVYPSTSNGARRPVQEVYRSY